VVLSKTRIDKLGERFRRGGSTAADVRDLDEYRRSFGSEYEEVVATIERVLNVAPTGRRAKTIPSIVAKLQRESIRLSQVQDIAGCRLVVADRSIQDRTVDTLRRTFADVEIKDRRVDPSYGYRAVHVIVRLRGRPIEIQVRTTLQHQWAEVSEKYSDAIPELKYGGGTEVIRSRLDSISVAADAIESVEKGLPTEFLTGGR
jgi:putative GTP pyrophosphokinase